MRLQKIITLSRGFRSLHVWWRSFKPYVRLLYFPWSFSLDKRVPFSAVSPCRSLQGANLTDRPGFKAKEWRPWIFESDVVLKKGDGPARLLHACFTFNMALKFRPVAVTAVLICDPRPFSVEKSYRPAQVLRVCFSLVAVLWNASCPWVLVLSSALLGEIVLQRARFSCFVFVFVGGLDSCLQK